MSRLIIALVALARSVACDAAPLAPLPQCADGPCQNVVYILSDDMRADLGSYGLPTHTPNLDKLASEGLRFEHAFCQISVCSPSRQSFMTGRRPDRSGVWNFIDANPLNVTATPKHFRDAGYLTLGLGKTFHEDGGAWNADNLWSVGDKAYFPYSSNTCPHGGEGGGHCVLPDDQIWDFKLLNATLSYLDYAVDVYKTTQRPFFLMTGFRDPHAPWAAPQRMYNLYSDATTSVATHKTLGEGTPLIAWSDELTVMLANGTSYPFGPYSPVPDSAARDQRHAYYAAISYVDEHVGAILAAVEAAGLASTTIIVFHSDHAYLLGEHGYWEKKSNFDATVRVPLIIKAPRKPASAGAVTASFIDLVDVFATVAALAGLPAPLNTDSEDQSALFDSPSVALKGEAFHQYPACGMSTFNMTRGSCNNTPRGQFDYMGYSIRNADWRYTWWLQWDKATLAPLWAGAYEEELYVHTGDDSRDMDAWENVNVAAGHPDVALQLRTRLRTFFEKNFDN